METIIYYYFYGSLEWIKCDGFGHFVNRCKYKHKTNVRATYLKTVFIIFFLLMNLLWIRFFLTLGFVLRMCVFCWKSLISAHDMYGGIEKRYDFIIIFVFNFVLWNHGVKERKRQTRTKFSSKTRTMGVSLR